MIFPHLQPQSYDVTLRTADPLLLHSLAGAFPPRFVFPLCFLPKWFPTTPGTRYSPLFSSSSFSTHLLNQSAARLCCWIRSQVYVLHVELVVNCNVLLHYVIVPKWLNQTSQRFVATRSGASIDEPRRRKKKKKHSDVCASTVTHAHVMVYFLRSSGNPTQAWESEPHTAAMLGRNATVGPLMFVSWAGAWGKPPPHPQRAPTTAQHSPAQQMSFHWALNNNVINVTGNK